MRLSALPSVPGSGAAARRTSRRALLAAPVAVAVAALSAGMAAGRSRRPVSARQDTAAMDYSGAGAAILGAGEVNVRDGAGFDREITGTLPVNARVTVTGPAEGDFLPIAADDGGVSGYAYALYVSIDGQPAPWLLEGAPGCDRIALAFNIGVGDPFEYGILDTLGAYGVPATFFAMGWTTDRDPDPIRAIAAAGFPVGTHGYTSLDLPTSSDADVLDDLTASEDSIRAVAPDGWAPYATPFAASTDERVRTLVSSLGILPVGWRISAADYAVDADPNAIWDRVVPELYDGAIIEMHIDAPASATSTGVALPWIIEAAQQRGYRFVSVPDMALPCGVSTAALAAVAGVGGVSAATPVAGDDAGSVVPPAAG